MDLTNNQSAESDVLFMSIGEGAIVVDARGHISRVNRKALEILDFSEEELVGRWFPEVIKAEDASGKLIPNLERPISEVFIAGEAVSSRVFYRRKSGEPIPVYLSVSPVMSKGKPVGAIEVFRDISDEIALEKAKDEFVAIASHQLRTPATAVKQYLGLLLQGYAEPLADTQKTFLERAYESNERQLQIVQEILKITQLDLEKVVLRLDLYDLRKIAEEAAAGLEGKFKERDQHLLIKLPREPVWANVDKDQIRIALENLLENASNYSPKGRAIEMIIRRTKKRVKLIINDEGVGINKNDLSKLFQKFSRIPNDLSVEVGGTGLGLYWAAKIIELHGGDIEVRSIQGKGSSFAICLPR